MSLTTRQKLSLVFSVYVSIFIALVGAIFFLGLHTILIYQVQKDATSAAANALKNHIAIEKETVTVVKDKTGGLLSDEVTQSNISILLLDNNLAVIRGYGLLELYNQGDQGSVETIAKMAKNAESSQKSYTKTVSWRGQDITVYVAPIKNSGKSYGSIVAAKPLTEIQSLEKTILLTLLGLTGGSALVSLILSRLLVGKVFKPIQSLTEIISATDLDKLDKTLTIPGSKSDELVILGDKFNEMMARLKAMSDTQKEFIANASHELKTPLSRAISSFDLAISSNNVSDRTLQDIRDDLFEISSLLDKLMFLSRLKPGMILPSDKLSLNRLILESVDAFRKQMKNQKVAVLINLARDTTVLIPKEYAKVLLGNLLSNAIKYSKEGGAISIRTQRMGDKTILTIADQGLGIHKSDLNRVEKRFFRGEGGKTVSGHGIGLAIVRKIVDLYKIGLSIESEAGKGTKVTLEFPTLLNS